MHEWQPSLYFVIQHIRSVDDDELPVEFIDDPGVRAHRHLIPGATRFTDRLAAAEVSDRIQKKVAADPRIHPEPLEEVAVEAETAEACIDEPLTLVTPMEQPDDSHLTVTLPHTSAW